MQPGRKQRANCETERKRLDKQSQRLTIALTALATLVGKETLDQAMSIFDTVGEVTNLASAEYPPALETNLSSPSYSTQTQERDVDDVRDVPGGYDWLYTPELDPANWHVAGSYLPGYRNPDMSIFFGSDMAAVPEANPLWFVPMWALTPKRKR